MKPRSWIIGGVGCAIAIACASDDARRDARPAWFAEIDGRAASFDWTGYSMAGAGDVDGDGRDDLLVSALSSNEGGRVSLHLGPLEGFSGIDGARAIFVGEQTFVNLGDSILHAGGCDVDGDGFDDVILGSPFADGVVFGTTATSGDNRGRVYVHRGGASLSGTVQARDAAATIVGEGDYDTFGSTVACLGDLDRDGRDDVAIAAKGSGRGGDDAGAVYVFYGPSILTAAHASDADAVLVGARAFEQAGYAVARAGDLDGDGRDEIVIGAPNGGDASEGRAYVVRGIEGRLAGELSLATAVTLESAAPGLRAGWSVDAAGDVDGDGLGDVVIGSNVAATTSDPGRAWLVRGRAALGTAIDLDRETVLSGERDGDLTGMGVAGVGDVTGDGLDDLVIGAPGVRDGDREVGRVHLVPGSTSMSATIALADAPWSELGPGTPSHFGENVARVGDLDGDGLASDFAVGAKALTTLAEGAGALLLYRAAR